MAYDSGSDRTVLFGGFTEERVFLGDTWAFDLDNNTWTNMNPSGALQARGDPGFAYDPDSDRVVLFGGIMKLDGETSYADLNDTWAYDFDTNTWQNRSPASAPSPRHGHKVAYDTHSHRFVMTGGHTCLYAAIPKTCTLFGDTWAYDYGNNTWTNMIPPAGPSTPNFHGLAYDSGSDRVVLYGGDGSTSRETWAYDFNANTWSRLNPQQNPGSLSFLSMAYDVASDRVVLFGGSAAGVRSAETWVYDLDTDTWTRMSPGVKPSPRQDHAMTYDTQSDRVVLFGGCAGLELQCNNETWGYDFETDMWTQLSLLASAPPTPLWVLGVGIGTIVAVAIAATWLIVKRRRGRPPRP